DFTTLTDVQKTIPEKLGFLHELGLDFGWGPTSCMQWLLEHIHVYAGTPWWGSIVLATVLIRVIQFPGYMMMSDNAAKLKEVQPFAAPLVMKLQKSQMAGDLATAYIAKKELTYIYNRGGITRKWMLFPLFQIPIFYGFYHLLRTMSYTPVPGLLEGGTLWFTDLTSADPFITLPIVASATMAFSIWLGGDAGSSQLSPQVRKFMLIGFPLISFLVMFSWPAALTLYFATNGVLGIVQNLLLRNATLREISGLYPMSTEPAP
ncbi:60Kd inner membrane protein-domain-containing protein, partial [Kalaharituber pfeilii]